MTTFGITKVYTSKNGAPYTPKVGEWYSLTVEFDVTGTPKNPYTVAFTMADRHNFVRMSDLTSGHKIKSADFLLALDDKIPWTVEVDPDKIADVADPTKSPIRHQIPDPHGGGGGQVVITTSPSGPLVAGIKSKSGSFTPAGPAKGIDFYDPRWLIATQSVFTTFKSGKIDRLACMVGIPATDSWQKQLSSTCKVEWGGGVDLLPKKHVSDATLYPVYLFDRKSVPNQKFSLIHQSVLEVRNQRVDAEKLRKVTWEQVDALKGIDVFKTYASPDSICDSKHKKIADYVEQTLGKKHRSKYSPYDAARKLFQEVLKRTTYYYPKPGETDKRPPTAVKMVDAGFGDCGGFSILLVALYRNIGFPARTACGAWQGQDVGHCWCEMYFPQNGWMVSDGSAGNSACEDGSFAYYFGSVPDLNARYACMRGNQFTIGDISATWLQGPHGPLLWGTSSVATSDAHTAVLNVDKAAALSLAEMASPEAMVSIAASPPTLQSIAFKHCPCHQHSGFSRVAPLRRAVAKAGVSKAKAGK